MKVLRRSHVYIGTACGILAASNRQSSVPLDGPHVSVLQALQAAKAQGAAHPASIAFPTETSPVYTIVERHEHDMLRVAIDARTAANVATVNDPLTWLNHFHENLLLGTGGRLVLTVSGILLAFMSISGAIIWFPRRRAAWKDKHRISGVIAVFPILLAAVTGISLQVQGLTPRGDHAGAHRHHGARPGDDRLASRLEPALRTAERSVPDAHIERVQLPQESGDPIVVTMLSGTVRNPMLESSVTIDPRNAKVESIVTPESRPPLERFHAFARALHTGVFVAKITQFFTVLSAFLLITTITTGFWRARIHFAKWLGKHVV